MKEMEMTCVVCPVGCQLRVSLDDGGKLLSIKGNRCPKGENYAREEVTDPKRTLPTNVKVIGGELPLVSVKTEKAIPKRLILDAMKIVKMTEVQAPVERGQVLIKNILETGVDVVATRTVKEKK